MFVRIALVVGIAVLAWSALARSSTAHGPRQVVTVRPYETLWTIAQRLVQQLVKARPRQGADVRVGQKLVLP